MEDKYNDTSTKYRSMELAQKNKIVNRIEIMYYRYQTAYWSSEL